MTEKKYKAYELREEIEQAQHLNNERVLIGMALSFRKIFEELPGVQARWRVWCHSLGGLYFDKPAVDIQLEQSNTSVLAEHSVDYQNNPQHNKLWYTVDHWLTGLLGETDIQARRDGSWTQNRERKYIYTKNLPEKVQHHLIELGGYSELYDFNWYGNLGFFEGRAKHWSKTPAAEITKQLSTPKDKSDVLIYSIINKSNYVEALAEIYIMPEIIEKIKSALIEAEQQELVDAVNPSIDKNNSKNKKIGKI